MTCTCRVRPLVLESSCPMPEDGGLNWVRPVSPETMAAQSDCLRQHIDRFAWLNGVRNDFWVGRNSKKRELSGGAGRPGLVSHLVKPPLRLAVMNVVRPGECDDIAIKQVNRQMSSSLRRTSSLVSGRAPADTSNTGNAFLVPRPRFCRASPRRALSFSRPPRHKPTFPSPEETVRHAPAGT
jgi:hypothetical protein